MVTDLSTAACLPHSIEDMRSDVTVSDVLIEPFSFAFYKITGNFPFGA